MVHYSELLYRFKKTNQYFLFGPIADVNILKTICDVRIFYRAMFLKIIWYVVH